MFHIDLLANSVNQTVGSDLVFPGLHLRMDSDLLWFASTMAEHEKVLNNAIRRQLPI